jgi:SEC-C motif-containing protein
MRCPCGRSAALESCCGRFIEGWELPDTAEDLMRSRFSAYVLGAIDYLVSTHDPSRAPDREAIARWSREAEFTSLTIVSTHGGGLSEDAGIVEFIAQFKQGGRDRQHHERSRFKRLDGRWFYVDAI